MSSEGSKTSGPEHGMGQRIKEARGSVRQNELARRTGINVQQLNRYECQDVQPSPSQMRRLCDALSVSPTWLLYGSETPHRRESLVDALLASDEGEEYPALRLAGCIRWLGVDDQRTIAAMVLRVLELQHGSDKLRQIADFSDELAAILYPMFEDGSLEREIIDHQAEQQTDWVGNGDATNS